LRFAIHVDTPVGKSSLGKTLPSVKTCSIARHGQLFHAVLYWFAEGNPLFAKAAVSHAGASVQHSTADKPCRAQTVAL